MIQWWKPTKDPDEKLDFIIDWVPRLAGDTIETSEWFVPVGITEVSNEFTPTLTKIWLTGGSIDAIYEMTNRVTTVGGRIMDESGRLRIRVG